LVGAKLDAGSLSMGKGGKKKLGRYFISNSEITEDKEKKGLKRGDAHGQI